METDCFGIKIDPKVVKNRAISMIKRLFPNDQFDQEDFNIDNTEIEQSEQSFEDKLNAVFKSNITNETPAKYVDKLLNNEFLTFEQCGKRPETLEKLYQALCTIPPTSVESERAFSAVGLFVTKIRSSLEDNTIDALLTLRNHFLNK